MLLTEKRALTQLRREVRTVLGDLSLTIGGAAVAREQPGARVFVISAIGAATRDAGERVSRAITEARSDARRVALERISAELGSIGLSTAPLARSDGAEDVGIGQFAGGSFASAWGASMMREVLAWADDPKRTPKLSAANDALDYRLARLAATEVASAYNDEHAEAALEVAKVPAWRGRLFRRWEAMLDRRLCKVCKAMDGQVVPVDASFTLRREPGLVHPMCRCIEILVGDDQPIAMPVPVTIRPVVLAKVFSKRGGTFSRGGSSGYRGGGGSSSGGGSTDSF
jgi:hypothetical protein